MPLEWFERKHTFGEKNDLYIEHAYELARRVTVAALEHALIAPTQVDHVIFISTTGLATPTLDARLANALGFRRDVRRTPIWGLGCAGGAAGLARAAEFARAAPESHTLVVAVELCSLAFQPDDDVRLGAVSASLFSDGAAAVVIGGPESWNAPTPLARLGRGLTVDVLATQSVLWPDSLDVMGWNIDERGLHVVMKREIPSAVQEWVKPALVSFLREQGMGLSDVKHWLPHPGGGRVLDAITTALGLSEDALTLSRAVLREHGNMSSPTCLFVLRRLFDAAAFAPGERAVPFALGPGFSGEFVLLSATTLDRCALGGGSLRRSPCGAAARRAAPRPPACAGCSPRRVEHGRGTTPCSSSSTCCCSPGSCSRCSSCTRDRLRGGRRGRRCSRPGSSCATRRSARWGISGTCACWSCREHRSCARARTASSGTRTTWRSCRAGRRADDLRGVADGGDRVAPNAVALAIGSAARKKRLRRLERRVAAAHQLVQRLRDLAVVALPGRVSAKKRCSASAPRGRPVPSRNVK